jgi:hypothetical protein
MSRARAIWVRLTGHLRELAEFVRAALRVRGKADASVLGGGSELLDSPAVRSGAPRSAGGLFAFAPPIRPEPPAPSFAESVGGFIQAWAELDPVGVADWLAVAHRRADDALNGITPAMRLRINTQAFANVLRTHLAARRAGLNGGGGAATPAMFQR